MWKSHLFRMLIRVFLIQLAIVLPSIVYFSYLLWAEGGFTRGTLPSVLLLFLSLVLSLVLGGMLAADIMKPVAKLREAVHGILRGDFLRIGIDRADELGELVRDFDSMTAIIEREQKELRARTMEIEHSNAALQRREFHQQAYREILESLNSIDLKPVLDASLQKMVVSANCHLGIIYLHARTERDPLMVRAAYAADGQQIKYQEGRLVDGLPIQVEKEGRTIILQELDPENEFHFNLGFGYILPRTVVGIPLSFSSDKLGVLVAVSLSDMQQESLEFLENSARQLSIAIHNATVFEKVRFQSQRLEILNVELEKASRIKSEFLANMSHELRTPLNSIIGFTDMLHRAKRDPLSERQRIAMEKVLRNSRHLLSLINSVLDIAKIEAGHMELLPEEFELRELVLDCLAAVEPDAINKGLAVKTSIPADLPKVYGDVSKVEEIIINLLSNAVKFTEKGRVDLNVTVGPEFLTVHVEDTGIGIEPENLEIIFEEFRQIDSSSTRSHGGTGLGLSIARKLSRLMGGDISVTSRFGMGSHFQFNLPVRALQKKPQERAKKHDDHRGRAKHLRKILVIDERRDTYDALTAALRDDYVLLWAATGAEGLNFAEIHKPSLILLDVILSDWDGWEVLQRLKSNSETAHIPVIINSMVENRSLALSLGASGYVTKPATEDEIRDAIEKLAIPPSRLVLVVDDDPDFRSFVCEVLEQASYDVLQAEDGRQAMDLMKTEVPDLVLLDLMMPYVDGFMVLAFMAQQQNLREVPVLIATAIDLPQEKLTSLKKQARDVIRKEGLTVEQIAARVRKVLEPPEKAPVSPAVS
jgi:signal transduction histidine kinase/DNA-binding response OmpR family regulator